MLAYLGFLITPFFILGIVWPKIFYSVLFFFAINIVLALGAVLGLGLSAVIYDQAYWYAYNMPVLLTNEYVDSLSWSGPFIKVFSIPWIFFVDLWRLYIDFTFNHARLAFWIPQAVSIYIAVTWIRIFRYL